MQHNEKIITLSIENLSSFGFACFHNQEEPSIEDDLWHREIELITGEKNNPQIVKIPKKFLIEISKENKIINQGNYKINFTVASIGPIKLLSERAGWNQTIADLEAMKAHGRLAGSQDKNGYLLATYIHKDQGITLGSGLSLPVSADMSWIGMILVHQELRRQGIARSIMNSCLIHARINQNKSIVGLDATAQGKQVYDQLGFKDSFKIWRSDISTNLEIQANQKVALKSFSLESIKNYLQRKNNEERFQIVSLLEGLPHSKNIMALTGGRVSGFVMSRPGRLKPFIGPLIADSDNVALSLLSHVLKHWKTLGFAHAFIDIPDCHIGQGSIFIHENHSSNPSEKPQFYIKKQRSFIRMYQLISKSEAEENLQKALPHPQGGMNKESEIALIKAVEGYGKTMTFMEKERREILPSMYVIGGPEMS